MTLRAACIMALIAVGVIVTTPRGERWVITDLPSDPNSQTFHIKGGKAGSAEVFRVSQSGVLTVHLRNWDRVCPCGVITEGGK